MQFRNESFFKSLNRNAYKSLLKAQIIFTDTFMESIFLLHPVSVPTLSTNYLVISR